LLHFSYSLCGLPEDEGEDDLDVWPPHHIPQRFWTWCKANFLTPIDAEYLRDFKALLLDKYSPEALKCYYAKRENGIHPSTPFKTYKVDSPAPTALSVIAEDEEIEQHYRDIGGRIVKMLVERGWIKFVHVLLRLIFKQRYLGLIPSSTEHVYREIAECSTSREIAISQEGKEDDDDSELVLQHSVFRFVLFYPSFFLSPIFSVVSNLLRKFQLFLLGINMYRSIPIRRVPTNTELPTLRTALRLRNRKARQHYGSMYKRLRKYRIYSK
uniref:ORF2 n=1 Tax=Angiostrongylus cantonensis TaxID=6313 RepID=A0A0K0DCG6_ANGCA